MEKILLRKKGRNNYLLKYEEAYVVSTSETDFAHGLPRDIQTFKEKLKQLIHDVGVRSIGNGIQPTSEQRYAHILVQRVNINEEEEEGHKRKTRTGTINVLCLSQKKGKSK